MIYLFIIRIIMNIFILSKNKRRCARYHCDRHVIKMILEYVQMLCACHRFYDSIDIPYLYKMTHKNHPCTVWVRTSKENYEWLYCLFVELCHEYTYRYDRVHLCQTKFLDTLAKCPEGIPSLGLTQFPNCTDHKDIEDPILAYRTYYKTSKTHLHHWKKREVPKFLI